MFAVVRTGGKQYRVAPGDKIVVEKMDGSAGDRVTLGDVLLAGEGSDLKSTDGLTVAAEIIAQAKGDKVTVFKKRRRHNYRRKKGHRQQHTILKIVAIGDHKHVPKKAEKAAKPTPGPSPAKPAKATPETSPKGPAKVEEQPTANPAPDKESQANPPGGDDDASTASAAPKGKKPAAPKAKSAAAPKAAAKAPSTKNAAPAKGAAKKTSKAK